jgi:thiol:disulfide interchange protein DsbD
MKNFLIGLFITLMAALPLHAAESEFVDTGKVVASLVSSHDAAMPGEDITVALRTILDQGWHTYWRNPGDSGEPVSLYWNKKGDWQVGEIVWPLPITLPTGPIINYGFEGAPLFPVKMTVPPNAKMGSVETIGLEFYYLVCKDVCIPESGEASIDLLIGEPVKDVRWDALIRDAINTAPKPVSVTGGITKKGDTLEISLADLPEGNFENAYFFPFDQGILMHSQPQNVSVGTEGIRITVPADYKWNETLPESLKGVVSYVKDGVPVGSEIEFFVGQTVNVGNIATAPGTGLKTASSLSLWGAIIGALIGGLILNLMPCVFPIISMKALSIAKSAHGERRTIKREAWAYTVGVLVTFFILTALLLILKAAGNEVGWGFQLQSPPVVAILALIIFAVGLNLLGLFDIAGQFQNTGSSLTTQGGVKGSFFTGLLAVIVATPCTAPFMAPAIGYALAQPAVLTIVIFMALALGFAFPFLLIAYVPKIVSALPKPGPWMETFKNVLAFPMFAAAIWLVWVLTQQSGANGMFVLLMAFLFLAFAVWVFKRGTVISKGLAMLTLVGSLILCLSLKPMSVSDTVLETEAWSPERVAELQAEGRPVFVDFTAAWCVTCKVNEMRVLKTDKTKALFNETNTAFLIADWTNKNDEIAAELERYGRAGVPLYLVFPPRPSSESNNSVKAEVLPQVLTYDLIKEALERAKS